MSTATSVEYPCRIARAPDHPKPKKKAVKGAAEDVDVDSLGETSSTGQNLEDAFKDLMGDEPESEDE